jgi:hypothetical protein
LAYATAGSPLGNDFEWEITMRFLRVIVQAVVLAAISSTVFAQNETSFTYQGELSNAGVPASGTFNVQFAMWDSLVAGSQLGSAVTINSLPIQDGRFTVELDFGAGVFDNGQRWLEITVDDVPLVPRQPITRAPYAIQTRGIFVDDNGHVGIGTELPEVPLHVVNQNAGYVGAIFGSSEVGAGVFGEATATDALNFGVFGLSRSTNGRGVLGRADANSGVNFGVYGESLGTSGRGVYGLAYSNSGTTYGVFGSSNSTTGRGVFGLAGNASGANYGGRFQSNSTSGSGVFAEANASSGTTYGGYFKSSSTSGFAGYFLGNGNDAVYIENENSGRGLRAVAPSDTAVWAQTTTGFAGVHGETAGASSRAVYGQASATSGTNYGVYGLSNSPSGYDFYAGGAGINYGASSSRRWKKNVRPIREPLEKLGQLQGVYFDWDEQHGGAHDVGMIAEDVGKVLPEIVQFEGNKIDASGMDYSKMTPLLVEAVNALRRDKDVEIAAMRADHEAEVADLRQRLADLEQRLDQLVKAGWEK